MLQRRNATGQVLRVVREEPVRSLGDAVAWAYGGDATQREVERADEYVTRHEDDDWGDVDGGERQHTADLRDALRGHRWDR